MAVEGETNSITRNFYIGLAKKDPNRPGLYTISPGLMTIEVHNAFVGQITCAMETAWLTNEIIELKPKLHRIGSGSIGEGLVIKTRIEREGDLVKFEGRTRQIPSEIKTIENFQYPEEFVDKAISEGKTIYLLFIPMSKEAYEHGSTDDSKTCIDWRQKDFEFVKPLRSQERIVCIKPELRQ